MSPWTDRLEAGARHSGLAGVVAGSGSLVFVPASAVDGILDFLVRDAIPHLVADQEVLFPALERILGRPAVTAGLDVEAAEIRAQTERLESLAANLHEGSISRSNLRALGRTLSALDGLLHGHAQRERSLCASAGGAQPGLDPGCATLDEALASAARRAHDRIMLVAQPAISYQAAVVMRNNPAANRAHAVTLANLLAEPASRARP